MNGTLVQMLLAIDPGITDAYALLGRTVLVGDLPVHQAQHGLGARVRPELDLHSFRELLVGYDIEHVCIERVTARPGQGVTSMFRFGEAAGALYGLIVGLGMPVTFVMPQQWQRFHQVGAAPDAARQRAVQLYPEMASQLARKNDHHRADALLLAHYAAHATNAPAAGGSAHGDGHAIRDAAADLVATGGVNGTPTR